MIEHGLKLFRENSQLRDLADRVSHLNKGKSGGNAACRSRKSGRGAQTINIERLNHIFRLGFGSAAIDAEICLRPVQCRVTFNRTLPPNVFYIAGWGVTIAMH